MATAFYLSFGTPVAILRPFNTYGPRQSARAVLPTIISQVASGKREVHLGALSPTRDFNYVDDTVSGFIAAMTSERAVGEVINLGTGYEVTIGDAARVILDVMGAKCEIMCDAERLRPAKSEVERLCADNRKAGELLGWKPAYGGPDGFRRGIQETVAWFTKPENLSRYKTGVYNI